MPQPDLVSIDVPREVAKYFMEMQNHAKWGNVTIYFKAGHVVRATREEGVTYSTPPKQRDRGVMS